MNNPESFFSDPTNDNGSMSVIEFPSITDTEPSRPQSSSGEVIEFRSIISDPTPDPEPPCAA